MTFVAILLFLQLGRFALWLSPGERAHKAEFWQAWEQRFGPIDPDKPPVAMLKTWFKQFKRTGLAPAPWLDANVGVTPPGGTPGAADAGGAPGGTNL